MYCSNYSKSQQPNSYDFIENGLRVVKRLLNHENLLIIEHYVMQEMLSLNSGIEDGDGAGPYLHV